MECSANIVDSIKLLTIFAKYSILGVSQGTSDKTKQKLGALSFISQKNRTTVSTDFFHF